MAFVPKVFVCMPRYSAVELGAAIAYCDCTNGSVQVVAHAEASSSATPHTFNLLLAQALDMRDQGLCTHFAMIHSDVKPKVTPEGRWLDILWREMEASGADLISAVIPIKEPARKRTSTAIGARDDNFCNLGYIANHHRGTLPTTFGPAETCKDGEVLVVNTGLFLADLRRSWWDNFAFEFRTKIDRRPTGRVALFAPEDWLLSRHIQANGGQVRATWAVQLDHHGEIDWPNYEEPTPEPVKELPMAKGKGGKKGGKKGC